MGRIKKSVISVILLTAMLISIIPINFSIFAEEGTESTAVGQLARFIVDDFYMFETAGSGANGYSKDEMPETVLILAEEYSSSWSKNFYKIATVDGSSHEIIDIKPWTYASNLEILGYPEPEVNEEGLVTGQVSITKDGETISQVILEEGTKEYVFTELGSKVGENAKYQWQIMIDEEENRWATIMDYVYPYAVISEALIANQPNEDGYATIRCIADDGSKKYVSGNLSILRMTDLSTASVSADATDSASTDETVSTTESDDTSNDGVWNVTINYVFYNPYVTVDNINGWPAYAAFAMTLASGSEYTGDIDSPPVLGYSPYVQATLPDGQTTTPEGWLCFEDVVNGQTVNTYYKPAPTVHFQNCTQGSPIEEREIIVFYIPIKSSFTVNYHLQNVDNDEYYLYDSDNKEGYTDSNIGTGLDKHIDGFTPLYYDADIVISGDNSTVVDIYYDRKYTLVDFDLGGGYGVIPYYVRYETQINLTPPTNPGYTFTGWTLTALNGKTADLTEAEQSAWDVYEAATVANAMITLNHDCVSKLLYTAGWRAATTSYTIAYWLEDPNYVDGADTGEKYSIWGVETVENVTTGQIVDGPASGDVPDSLKYTTNDYGQTVNELNYLDFVQSDQDVEISGDGSTVVNVYYDRKEYTLKFYYAIQQTSGNTDSYHIIGGSTYYFGSNASTSNNNDEKTLIAQYRPDAAYGNQTGQVSALPTLNTEGLSREYTVGSDTTTSNNTTYNYHYISFNSKYGADISDLWPCAVFNPATRTDKDNTNGWSGNSAFVSAWNGEYNVKYTLDGAVNNGNQTIKGNYTVLDENLLWQSGQPEDDTVSFACFWENGANIGWSVPELYRYNLWVPILEGQDTTGITTEVYNGITYYLFTSYDTCDDSNVDAQTQPALVGFEHNGRTSNSITNPDSTLYSEAWEMHYYYKRNTHTLSFNNQYGTNDSQTVSYGESLSGYSVTVPHYPGSVEKGAMEFVGDTDGDGVGDGTGWYLDSNGNIAFTFDGQTMPDNNIQLYAKWEDCYYDATVYLQKGDATPLSQQTDLLFGTRATEPQNFVPPASGYIFAGWYYDDGSGESRFDFNTMAIKEDVVIYAKWTSKVPVKFTVKYMCGQIEIADRTEGYALAGVYKSFNAKIGEELHTTSGDDYQKGYFPVNRSHTMQMSADSTNEYTFYYSKPTTMSYKVTHTFTSDRFVEIIGKDTLSYTFLHRYNGAEVTAHISVNFRDGIDKNYISDGKTVCLDANNTLVDENGNAFENGLETTVVDKIWEVIVDLSPDAVQKELILEANESNNVIDFDWSDRGTVGAYQVEHYVQKLGGDASTAEGYALEKTVPFMGNYGETYEASAITIHGFTYNEANSLNYISGTLTKPDLSTSPGDENYDNGLVLKLYYTRNTYTYTVKHQFGSLTVTQDDLSAQYEETVTAKEFDFPESQDGSYDKAELQASYFVVGNDTQSRTITSEGNTIYFVYNLYEVYYFYQAMIAGRGTLTTFNETVGVNQTAKGSVAEANAEGGYVFEGWYVLETDGSHTKLTEDSEYVYSLEGGELIPDPKADFASKSIYFYANFVPTTLVIESKNTTDAHIYRIQGTNSGVDLTFTINGAESVTITNLVVDTYTITMDNGWSWRYDAMTKTVDFNDNMTVTFDYSGGASSDTWLGDSSYADVTVS